jgi:hypothetical protein
MSTLSTGELLFDVLEAFKVRFPMLMRMGTDFSSDTARFNEQITARIASLPTVRDYDATTGYKANAANANDLTTDIPVTLNRHKHVPVKIDYIDQISTRRNLYEETVSNLAYQLGKEAFDYIMTLIVAANFSESSTFTTGNSDLDLLNDVTKDMNAVGAAPIGRFGVVNSDVFETLQGDSRIASGDYHNQRRTDNAYGHLKNVGGFSDIWEYPDLPANAENLTGFFSDRTGIVMASRLPRDMFALAESLGIDPIGKAEVMSDEETGLSLMAIKWQESGTFDLYTTLVWLYGVSAGSQGGDAGDKTDYGLHRVVSA